MKKQWIAIASLVAIGVTGVLSYAIDPTRRDTTSFGPNSMNQSVPYANNDFNSDHRFVAYQSAASSPAAPNVATKSFNGTTLPPAVYTQNGEVFRYQTAPSMQTPAIGMQVGQFNQPNHGMIIIEDGKFLVVQPNNGNDPELHKKVGEAQKQIHDAIKTLRSESEDEPKRDEARKTVSNYLEAQFDSDLKSRTDEIEKLEKQIDKMKSQLKKREGAKQKLIELRLTLLENDQNGLGFPMGWNNIGDNPTPSWIAPPMPGGYGVSQPAQPAQPTYPPAFPAYSNYSNNYPGSAVGFGAPAAFPGQMSPPNGPPQMNPLSTSRPSTPPAPSASRARNTEKREFSPSSENRRTRSEGGTPSSRDAEKANSSEDGLIDNI